MAAMQTSTSTFRAACLVLALVASLGGGLVPARAQDTGPYRLLLEPVDSRLGPVSALPSRLELGLFDLGVAVAPRRPTLTPMAAESSATSLSRLGGAEAGTTDIGLDLRLRWPTSTTTSESPHGTVQPYLSLGPALSVPVGEEPLMLGRTTTRPEPAMSVGMRGALGLTWRVAPEASLFGEYRLIQDRPGSRTSPDTAVDLFYGFSLRF
jgi:hypothetical protein